MAKDQWGNISEQTHLQKEFVRPYTTPQLRGRGASQDTTQSHLLHLGLSSREGDKSSIVVPPQLTQSYTVSFGKVKVQGNLQDAHKILSL